jgi:RinA family phage transcriptional activator
MLAKVNYSLSKATFKHIEAELYKYKNTVEEIKKLRYNIIQSTPDENVGGGRSGLISKPTEMLATRLDTHKQLDYLEDIVYAIETVYNISPQHYRKLINIRYFDKSRVSDWEGTASELHCSKKTAQRWRDKIVYDIAEVLGWR